MRADEMPAFKDLLTDAMAYYGKDCSAFTLTVWWGALQGCELEQVATALQRHAMDPERGQFAPKVADLVRVLQGTSTDRAALAWGKVHEAMSAVGAYRDVVFDDPAIHAVVEDLGGWPKVCRTDTKELSYLQHRFQEAHRAYTARGQCDYQRRLAGDRSPDHEYSSRGIPLPRPAVVGDPQRAMAVIQHGSVAGKTRISTLPAQAMRLLAGASLQEVRA
ncbi:DUF6475 domain-containing protein [Comamonas terrigena]|uniref:DUF6475 domain-containing protein n=1 Tax=Comamonas terrigena TaxID=32013 RepID=UPI0024479656|nr:DUF6475 domain-containing protein [Comamonas terrigena]MDH1701001.1 DUF6475 domain-containing protein [Comamonas terrigena]